MFRDRGFKKAGEQDNNPEQLNLERQKKKLVGFYLSGGKSEYIFESDKDEFSERRRLPEEERLAKEMLRDNYDEELKLKEYKLLTDIEGPDAGLDHRPMNPQSIENIFRGMANDKHQRRILGYMTGMDWEMYESTSARNVTDFLTIYKTPMDFERASKKFLQDIRENNDADKTKEYVEAVEEFQLRTFGKKYEYYKAMKELHREAQEIPDETAVEQVDFSRISAAEAKRILRKTKIEGDPTMLPDMPERKITTRELARSGLEPRFKIGLDGAEYNVSQAFKVGSHDAVICYVKTPDGKTVARSYYRSGSQGMWRYLPDYGVRLDGGLWYGKGAGEQQLTLPMEIQGPLNEVAKNSENSDNAGQTRDNITKEECFFGVAKRIQNTPLLSTREYVRQRRAGEIKDALGKEVHSQPWINLRRQSETAPEHMEIPPLLAPNFGKQVGEFDLESRVYGKATVRSYRSNNDGVIWAVVEDEYGRACMAGAQMKAKITSTGLREAWVDVGSFAMPLYEYPAQDRGLGDRSDWRGQYVGMWKNYLSKMPVIQEYLEARKSGK